MEQNLADFFPILELDRGVLVSRQGDWTAVFAVRLPEIFTRSAAHFEGLHQGWLKALRVLPPGSIVHQQDYFLQDRYQAELEGLGFLGRSSARFFNERPFFTAPLSASP